MTVSERVAKFLKDHKGRAFCDNCLKIRLTLGRPQVALHAATALAATDEFSRAEAHCAGCGGAEKVVTWAL